jgi:CRP-like cAMP-binding protein
MELKRLIIDGLNYSNSDYNRFLDLLETRILDKKEYLLKADKVCQFIGFVEEGVLRSYREKDGEEYISDFYVSGSFVTSYRSFLRKEPSVGAIQALNGTKVQLLSRTNYDLLLSESPVWYKFGKYIADDLFIKKCIKETSLLMDSALERYQLLLKTYTGIEQYVSQYHIASYLGIKPESLSRLKSLNLGQF